MARERQSRTGSQQSKRKRNGKAGRACPRSGPLVDLRGAPCVHIPLVGISSMLATLSHILLVCVCMNGYEWVCV